jgi:hypothetical protein
MKMTIADFQDVIDERTFDAMGDVDRNLPTVGASGLFGRGASQEVRPPKFDSDRGQYCESETCPGFGRLYMDLDSHKGLQRSHHPLG